MEPIAVSRTESRKPSIRLLAVIPGKNESSSFVFARRQVESLKTAGVAAELFFLEGRTAPAAILREFLRLRTAIRRFKPDILHAQYGTVTGLLCTLASGRTPVVVTFRGSDLNRDRSLSVFRTSVSFLFSQLAAIMASAVICTSEALRNKLWFKKKNTVVIPSGIDLQSFAPASKQGAREKLGWQLEESVVLFNAGFAPELKGIDIVVAAVDLCKLRIRDLRFVVLDGSVAHSEIPVVMNAADCLVLASKHEGSPNVVKEALACNLPVVSVDVGDVRARLDGVQPSFIVERSPKAIGEALYTVLKSGIRSNGRDRVQELSEEKLAGRVHNLYRDLIKSTEPAFQDNPMENCELPSSEARINE